MSTTTDTEETITIFRRYANGEVIALFPDWKEAFFGCSCMSYMHVGQHSAANYGLVINDTDPCPPRAYKPLAQELAQRGYNLRILRRRPSK